MVQMNMKHQLFVIIHVCKYYIVNENKTKHLCRCMIYSELAQKVKAQREATRALHAEGVVKKKEIIAKSVIIKSSLQVYLKI